MSSTDYLRSILEGSCVDTDTGQPVSVPTNTVLIESKLKGHEADLVAELDLGSSFLLVYDIDTGEAMGRRVERALNSLGKVQTVELPRAPHPDQATATALTERAASSDAIIAVGSGVINDLCKYVAAAHQRRCAVFATAASMNGYTSVNVAITVHGHKKSLPAVAPTGVFVELDVLCNAPAQLTQAGLGDSLCRCTAQSDWLLASYLKGSSYRHFPFEILADDEAALMEDPAALLRKDHESMRRLARVLMLSGFGMTICGGSYPASQGEHLISHYTDMMKPANSFEDLHGRQIAVTSLTMARLQEQLLGGPAPVLKASTSSRQALVQQFGAETGEECWQELEPKLTNEAEAVRLNGLLTQQWDEIRERILSVRRTESDMRRILTAVGAPTKPSEVGWQTEFYRGAVLHAREIRNRYTSLDLAADAGLLDSFVAAL